MAHDRFAVSSLTIVVRTCIVTSRNVYVEVPFISYMITLSHLMRRHAINPFSKLNDYSQIFIYDVQQVKLVWPSKWSLAKALFVLNRYMAIADTFLYMYSTCLNVVIRYTRIYINIAEVVGGSTRVESLLPIYVRYPLTRISFAQSLYKFPAVRKQFLEW